MSWWQPLLDIYQEHLLKCHSNQGEYELNNEYYMKEQNQYITCDFCKWAHRFTINFDLLVGEEE